MWHTNPLTDGCGLTGLYSESLCQSGRLKRTLRFECGTGCVSTPAFLGRIYLQYIIIDMYCSSELADTVVKYVKGN